MKANLFRERARLPAFHSRSGNRNPINCPSFYRHVTTDLFKAFPAKHLAGARDMTGVRELMCVAVLVEAVLVFHKRRACDAEPRIGSEFLQQELKIVRAESDVGIQIADEIPRS